jgi:hypothetical protein
MYYIVILLCVLNSTNIYANEKISWSIVPYKTEVKTVESKTVESKAQESKEVDSILNIIKSIKKDYSLNCDKFASQKSSYIKSIKIAFKRYKAYNVTYDLVSIENFINDDLSKCDKTFLNENIKELDVFIRAIEKEEY